METEETDRKIQHILDIAVNLPIDNWKRSEHSAYGDHIKYYTQVKNDITFRFYPPNEIHSKPSLDVALCTHNYVIYTHMDKEKRLTKLWATLNDLENDKKLKIRQDNLDIIYKKLIE